MVLPASVIGNMVTIATLKNRVCLRPRLKQKETNAFGGVKQTHKLLKIQVNTKYKEK